MSQESDGYISFGAGIIFGLGVGAILGILYAPKAGQTLRSDIKEMANDLPDNFNSSIEHTRSKAKNIIDKTKYAIEKQISQVGEAFKAGKMAAAKKREELEEGLSGC